MTATQTFQRQAGSKEAVRVDEVAVGDAIDFGTWIGHVLSVRTLWLAEPMNDRTIATSNPPDHRWPVLHILTEYGGVVRFGHEWLQRIQ